MSFELWLAFSIASAVLLVIPGPTILTVIAYASSRGKSATLPLVVAVSLGDISVISLSVLGLGSLLAISSNAFIAVKVAGGLYLLYLGYKMIASAGANNLQESVHDSDELRTRTSNLFFNTWLVTALNPKGIIFFGAFLPQFIQTDNPVAPQLAILSITFIFLAAINTLSYALLASKANRLLSSEQAKKRFDIGGGLMMSAAGIWALSAKHTP